MAVSAFGTNRINQRTLNSYRELVAAKEKEIKALEGLITQLQDLADARATLIERQNEAYNSLTELYLQARWLS